MATYREHDPRMSVNEMKTTTKPREIKAMIMEPNNLTEHDLGTTNSIKLEITHNGKTLKFKKSEILQKLFAEKTWLGDTRRYYLFCKLTNGTPELIGLEKFDPYNGISSEEADIMVHEAVTVRGVRNLVTAVKGKGGGLSKGWIIFIVIVIVIAAVVMKSQGMIG